MYIAMHWKQCTLLFRLRWSALFVAWQSIGLQFTSQAQDQFFPDDELLNEYDPQRWMVYGSALDPNATFLGGNAELFIQPLAIDGSNISAEVFAQIISVVIEPPPSEPRTRLLENGALHLRYIWRQVDLRITEGISENL